MTSNIGQDIHDFAKLLWPINRSITGEGVRKTLSIIKDQINELEILEIKSGTKVFDWSIPPEWNVERAFIICPDGSKICDFENNNLHLVGYSEPVDMVLPLHELQKHLHSLPNMPDAVPYVTSYYDRTWGFCISHKDRMNLQEGIYRACINSTFTNGSLTYGELLIKGKIDSEIFFSTYICHPSMANNEISGPAVMTYISKYLIENKYNNKFSYRIIFIPETIGSIAYLSVNSNEMKKRILAGFNISCIGDERAYSYLQSRYGNTLSDKVAKHVLQHIDKNYLTYTWSERGSDERQYCSPGIDLPVASLMRSKYGTYSEYHTSKDDLINVVTPQGLSGGFNLIKKIIIAIENNCIPIANQVCEPQLGKRGLYQNLSKRNSSKSSSNLMNILTWADGQNDLIDIANYTNTYIEDLIYDLKILEQNNLIKLK